MGEFSPIIDSRRLPVDIRLRPYLRDHRFEGQAVYPAVEAMQIVAAVVEKWRPAVQVRRMIAVRFEKFLFLPSEGESIPAFVEISTHADGDLTAALLTRTRIEKVAISRVKTHARLTVSIHNGAVPGPVPDPPAGLEGNCFRVPADRIYAELVPFGPAYRNLENELVVSPEGAVAAIRSPEIAPEGPLGSPFPLDAAFHAACVWSQRYAGIVAFPVGLAHRVVATPARAGRRFCARLVPVDINADALVFDIWIEDVRGCLLEWVAGVRMRDVSGGRWRPPHWIRDGAKSV